MGSLDKEPRIKIDGVDSVWVLMNNENTEGDNGAVATQELFDAFAPSYAHMTNGIIMRHGRVIARREQWHYVIEGEK